MAYTKQQKKIKAISQQSGDILVKFANAKSPSKAILRLHQRFYRVFNVSLFNAKKMSKCKEDLIREDQQRLKKLFDELLADKALKESETIEEYNLDYYCLCHGQFVPDARYQDGIFMLHELEANGGTPFDAVLAILVFQYLRDENRQEIKKCQRPQCSKYFLARNNRKKCCSDAHKQAKYRLNKASQNPNGQPTQQTFPDQSQNRDTTAMVPPVSPS
jgi:predicted RNA-binding Zn ribbon-like protein